MKRIVTYFYEYHNAKKGNNIGFLKLDQRGTECRMLLHLQSGPQVAEKGESYLLVQHRSDGTIQGILLGEVSCGASGGEAMYRFEQNNMLGSGYALPEVKGVAVRFPSSRYLASCWVEEPLEALTRGTFTEFKGDTEDGTGKASDPGEMSVETTMDGTGKASDRGEMSVETTMDETGKASDPGEMSVETTMDETGKASNRGEMSVETAEDGTGKPSAPEETRVNTTMNGDGESSVPGETRNGDTEDGIQMPWEPKSMGQENMDGNSPNTSGFSSKTGGTGQESVDHLEGNELQIREPAEEQNTLHKVDLNEIKKLPKRNWYLCNNSFLIHGYFNYHHLIIHETVRNGCKKSYLGVPGVFERPEHTMALLFGFPEFISEQDLLKKQEKETESDDYPEGTFGYWLCLLDL